MTPLACARFIAAVGASSTAIAGTAVGPVGVLGHGLALGGVGLALGGLVLDADLLALHGDRALDVLGDDVLLQPRLAAHLPPRADLDLLLGAHDLGGGVRVRAGLADGVGVRVGVGGAGVGWGGRVGGGGVCRGCVWGPLAGGVRPPASSASSDGMS